MEKSIRDIEEINNNQHFNRATSLYPLSNLSIVINAEKGYRKNLSLAMTQRESCFKKSPTHTSKIMEKLAETERKFERKEKFKNMMAFKSMNSYINDHKNENLHLGIRKKFKMDLTDLTTEPKIADYPKLSSTPRNNHLSLSRACDYHILNYFKTIKSQGREERSWDEEYYSPLTKANVDRYQHFFHTFNKIESKMDLPEHSNRSKIAEIKKEKNQGQDQRSSQYIGDMKEKDLSGMVIKKKIYVLLALIRDKGEKK